MSSTATKPPWSVGDRVRLDRPERPTHPRKGRTGTVIRTRYFPEKLGRDGVIENGVWMAVVRFDPVCRPDRYDELGVGAEWRVFEGEISIVREKGKDREIA